MKQKKDLKILEISVIGISYRSINGWYISIGPKKVISVNL